MNKILILCLLAIINIQAVDFGKIISQKGNSTSHIIANDIANLLKKYHINLNIENTEHSHTRIEKLLKNSSNNFFAIVQKDSIVNFNKTYNKDFKNTSIYKKIPAILSLGNEQIHIFSNENKEFDFELNKKYNVYCGDKLSSACLASKNIQEAYDFDFKYPSIDKKDILSKLADNTIDLYIAIAKAPFNQFKKFKGVSLLDLPTNFVMEEMYTHSQITKTHYTFVNDTIHAFSSPLVLITNLNDEKYNNVIRNLIKIILLNKKHLVNKHENVWKDINFEYFDFKYFSKIAKKEIVELTKEIKQSNALIF